MENIKKVVAALLQEFAKEEAGNRVTSNNIFGLSSKLMAALDGQITLKPADDEPVKEK
jgi:hypothetical protein